MYYDVQEMHKKKLVKEIFLVTHLVNIVIERVVNYKKIFKFKKN